MVPIAATSMNLLRSIAAVVLGYIVFAVSAVLLFQVLHADPHAPQSVAFMTGTAVYGIAFAFLGGLLAARVAPRRPVQHAGLVSSGDRRRCNRVPPCEPGRRCNVVSVDRLAPHGALGGLGAVGHADSIARHRRGRVNPLSPELGPIDVPLANAADTPCAGLANGDPADLRALRQSAA